jgi:hypothetical protein
VVVFSQTKSVWVFILGNTWGDKMSNPKRISASKQQTGTGGFLLIWPAMGLDARFSAPRFHSIYTAHAASSPDWLRAQRPCLENPNMVTHGLRLARA